ncbi:hypothetical protein J6590_003171 [Homalodisca vitripennis]|nr:hypothetical protein J6590_003171 [Homalodisca vitripennis]
MRWRSPDRSPDTENDKSARKLDSPDLQSLIVPFINGSRLRGRCGFDVCGSATQDLLRGLGHTSKWPRGTGFNRQRGVNGALRSKAADFGSELEIAQDPILSVAPLSVLPTVYCIRSPPYSGLRELGVSFKQMALLRSFETLSRLHENCVSYHSEPRVTTSILQTRKLARPGPALETSFTTLATPHLIGHSPDWLEFLATTNHSSPSTGPVLLVCQNRRYSEMRRRIVSISLAECKARDKSRALCSTKNGDKT